MLWVSSPEAIEKNSYGEVTTSAIYTNLFNNREYGFHHKKNSLFCQNIFGPVVDYCCACEKYCGQEFVGKICEICDVEITLSAARSQRFGHIDLPIPFLNPIFLDQICVLTYFSSDQILSFANRQLYQISEVIEDLKTEYIANIAVEAKKLRIEADGQYQNAKKLAKENDNNSSILTEYLHNFTEKLATIKDVENIATAEMAELKVGNILDSKAYNKLRKKYEPLFKAITGVEVIEQKLKSIDLKNKIDQMQKNCIDANGCIDLDRKNEFAILAYLEKNNLQPEWLLLRKIPVIPPNLRPLNPNYYQKVVKPRSSFFLTEISHAESSPLRAFYDLCGRYDKLLNSLEYLNKMLATEALQVIVCEAIPRVQKRIDELYDSIRSMFGYFR